MDALVMAIYFSTGVLMFAWTWMAFLSAYANKVQSDYLMTVCAKSGPNRYGKIN